MSILIFDYFVFSVEIQKNMAEVNMLRKLHTMQLEMQELMFCNTSLTSMLNGQVSNYDPNTYQGESMLKFICKENKFLNYFLLNIQGPVSVRNIIEYEHSKRLMIKITKKNIQMFNIFYLKNRRHRWHLSFILSKGN